MTWMVDNMDGW